MLKIMDEKMKHEEDKWLEQQLTATVEIKKDDFTARIMAEVKTHQSKQMNTRKQILWVTYLASIILFTLITPWSWLITKVNETQSVFAALTSINPNSEVPVIGLAIAFVMLFTVYIFGEETN